MLHEGEFTYTSVYQDGKPYYGLNSPRLAPSKPRHASAEAFIAQYAAQTGLRFRYADHWQDTHPIQPDYIEAVEAYIIPADTVNVPRRDLYVNDAFYYHALFHEIGHSTLAKSRLDNRRTTTREEEIRAESVSRRLMDHFGLSTPDTEAFSDYYLENWRNALDPFASLMESFGFPSKPSRPLNDVIDESVAYLLTFAQRELR